MNWRAYVVPALVLALVCALGVSYYEGRQAGAYAVRFHSADSVIADLLTRKPKVDTVFSVKVIRLKATRSITDTNLARYRDSVPLDTARHMLAMERAACDTVVQACQAKVAIRDSLIDAQNRKIQLLLHKPHSFFGGIGGKVTVLGLGFLLGRAVH